MSDFLIRRLRLDGAGSEERSTMHSKVALLCYCTAVGFILAVAFHSSAKLLITADVPVAASSTK
jgi:hypothetical protein